jgi:two-component system LytT family sensor kinase
MKNTFSRYWLFQFVGWTGLILLYTFFYFSLSIKHVDHFFLGIFLEASEGLLITHIMRFAIRKIHVLQKKIDQQIVLLIIITLAFAILFAAISIIMESYFGIRYNNTKVDNSTFVEKLIRNSFNCFLYLTIWNLIYFTYHYVTRSRDEQVQKIKLEALVKELELKTIKAHINPHFIFNALNSIRALVDENPTRARTAITELSNILRSSMRADKVETVPLQNELDIVKDYLALEQIRFEERLNVVFNVDIDTLSQPVPPMMVQTLVENAIKHGIGKTVAGGTIELVSDFKGGMHEIIIRNTGHINGSASEGGFGITSTKNRLQLLYGSKASFQIKDIGENEVEAKLLMPMA